MDVATAVALIVGWCAAHAAGLLTRAGAPEWVLGAVTTVLSTLAGVLPTVAYQPGDRWERYLLNVFVAFAGALAGHLLRTPHGVQAKTPRVGVGRPR